MINSIWNHYCLYTGRHRHVYKYTLCKLSFVFMSVDFDRHSFVEGMDIYSLSTISSVAYKKPDF